jgi:hypothetical protein
MITARSLLAGAGTQNAGLAFGGATPATPTAACTEEYNGSTWAAGGAMITARNSLAGTGTQNAALAFGNLTCTEAYNGTAWTAKNGLNTGRFILSGAGTQTSALAFGGAPSATEAFSNSNSYNVSLAGEFLITPTGTTVSSPTYLCGSNSSIYYGYYQIVVIGGKTYFILID